MSAQRFNKACDSCHISKVRCVPDPQAPVGTVCKRCSRNATPCVFSPVGPRRRPMRTKNERIAELERRVKDMQLKLEKQVEKRAGSSASASASTLPASSSSAAEIAGPELDPDLDPADDASGPGRSGSAPTPRPEPPQHPAEHPSHHPSYHALSSSSSSSPPPPPPPQPLPPLASLSPPSDPDADVLDRGLLTAAQADQLVREFRAKLHGKCLGISLPDGLTADQLRRRRPAFWLSVLCAAAAASLDFLPLAPVLFAELKKMLDQRLMLSSNPDLDALQALMNYVSFHHDPAFPLGQQLLQISHTAVAVAVSMGERSPLHKLPPDAPLSEQDVSDEQVQLSRELLHWYWASFSLSIKNRKSIMLRKIQLVEASMRILKISGMQHDLFLVEWIKITRIAADTVLALHQGHTQAEDGRGLSDEARDQILDTFEKRRKQWLVECPFDLVNETLMLEYHYIVLLISEVVFPAGVADFAQRSQGLPSISPRATSSSPSPTATADSPQPHDQNLLASYKIRYTRKCVAAAHACLDLVTNPADLYTSGNASRVGSSDDLLRHFGSLPYGRIFYALRFLLFLAHEIWKTGRYDLIDVSSLRIGPYIAALGRCLTVASAEGKFRTPSLWVYALRSRIQPWYRNLCALLEASRPSQPTDEESERTPGEQEGDGERTPGAGSPSVSYAQPLSGSVPPPVPPTDSPASKRLHDASDVGRDFFSPLLFDFPFEILSSGGLDLSSASPLSRSSNARRTHDHGNHPATPAQSTTTMTPTAANMLLPSQMRLYSMATAPSATSPSSLVQHRLSSTASSASATHHPPGTVPATDSSSAFGDMGTAFGDMELYPLDFNWGDLNSIFPGSDMLSSPFPPLSERGLESPTQTQGFTDNGTGKK